MGCANRRDANPVEPKSKVPMVVAAVCNPVEFEPGLGNRGRERKLVNSDVVSADIETDRSHSRLHEVEQMTER